MGTFKAKNGVDSRLPREIKFFFVYYITKCNGKMQWADEFWNIVFLTTHSLGDGSEQKMSQIVEKVHTFVATLG